MLERLLPGKNTISLILIFKIYKQLKAMKVTVFIQIPLLPSVKL